MTSFFTSKGIIAEKETISLNQIIDQVKNHPRFKDAGDIITFTGTVRETSVASNKRVTRVEIQAYKEKADKQLNQICQDLIIEYELIDARLIHFTGIFEVGEVLVHCVIASKHRKEGFEALKDMIDTYKHKAFVFKCEIYEDGTEQWISTEFEKKGKKNDP